MGSKRVFSVLLHTSWPDPFGSVTTCWQSEGSNFQPGAGEAREPWAPWPPGKCESVRAHVQVIQDQSSRCSCPCISGGF